jgi:hypothetical protein
MRFCWGSSGRWRALDLVLHHSGGVVEAAVTIEVGQAAIAEEKTWFGWRTMKNGMVNAPALSRLEGGARHWVRARRWQA